MADRHIATAAAADTPRGAPGMLRMPYGSYPAMHRTPDPPPLTDDIALFLDIDGTLLEFAPSPDKVKVGPRVFSLLNSLTRRLNGAIALVTGRAIADVDRLFQGLQMPVSGQHGCERRATDGRRQVHAPAPRSIERLRAEMHKLAAAHPGLMLEDKGITLALHYRRVPHLAAYVHRAVRDLLAQQTTEGTALQLLTGKMIVEVKPGGRDKGTAILDYMSEAPFAGRTPVFVGDDDTDEHGFHAVHSQNGWSVKVGHGPTHADYRLSDVSAVLAWLATLEKGSRVAPSQHA